MIKQFLKDFKNLILGMGITGKHLGRHAITLQYPEEKWPMPERSRGIVVLLSDKETGELNCTGCELCMRACPTAAIMVVAPRDPETKRRTLNAFSVDNALCCFCGLCEEACNFSALKMATKYEFATIEKDDLFWDMDKLQEMGLDVDYVDKRKKKPVKPAVTKPPEAKPTVDKPPVDVPPVAKPDAVKPDVVKSPESTPDSDNVNKGVDSPPEDKK